MPTITPVRRKRLEARDDATKVTPHILNLWLQAGNANTKVVRYGSPYQGDPPDLYGDGPYGQAGNYTVEYYEGEIVARLPTVGGDIDSWGQVLNTFLGVFFDSDGEAKYKGVETMVGNEETFTITLPATMDNASYVVTVTPSWNTTVWIPVSTKTTTQFVVHLGTPPEASEVLNWWATPNA